MLDESSTDVVVESKRRKRDVMRNFCFLSVCFSLNHACVAGCISLASSDLGENLASISLGVRFSSRRVDILNTNK